MRLSTPILVVLLACFRVGVQGAAEQCGRTRTRSRNKRIISGDETSPHQYPWMVSLQAFGVHGCGGVLISPFFVLSAAHCFFGENSPVDVTVVMDVHGWKTGKVRIEGSALIHSKYADDKEYYSEHDIALVRLSTAAPLSEHIQPVCLPGVNDTVEFDDELLALGWGMEVPLWRLNTTKEDGKLWGQNRYLNQLPLRVQNDTSKCLDDIDTYNEVCAAACKRGELVGVFCADFERDDSDGDAAGRKLNRDSANRMICAVHRPKDGRRKDNRKRAVCVGDSGGPLMKQRQDGSWVVAGIVSMGAPGCTTYLESHPQPGSIFTDVLSHADWIASSMQSFDHTHVSSGSPPRHVVAGRLAPLFLALTALLRSVHVNST